MKILHKSKRSAPPHPQVLELIISLLNTQNDSIPQVLGQIDVWTWPRSDLNAWIKVLNKFDAILEDVIRDYAVDTLQTNAFTPLTKKTVCEILRFERLLLENSTNRKMFNSYDRLNSFLFTSDLDVLVLSLNLLLRPSQQYSAQPSVSHALSISTSRLQSLAKRWPNLREYGVSLVDLVNANSMSEVDDLPAEAREVNYSFYRTDSSTAAKERDHKMETDVLETPQSTPRKPSLAAPSGASTSGAVLIHIDQRTLETKESMDLLADVIESHSIPEQEKFELMCRIRSAMVLNKGREGDREKLIIVRLLAIAIFGHTHPEAQAQSSLFLYEPDLITHIAELLQLDRGVPTAVQTVAIAALDALARYRNKIQEVLTAVNAGVNHGILMALVRKTVADVANPQSTLPHAFVEAMLSFVTFIASHAAGGNMVVGAGLVPLLIQVIENRLPKRLPVVSKTMQLVDNVLYSFTNAFQLFCAGRGVEILVERIQYEVDLDIKEYGDEQKSRELFGSYGQLPVARAAILKHTLRSMHRMMQSSGTAEGLRGLIDSSILKSVKKIIEFRGLFGPSVLPIAINIMATFVHNEPTSLAIIQEAGLPESFYRAIESGLEPVIEVIQAIPNAIGALCLNQAGQDQLSARPGIIPGIFSIFTSERHLKVLQDKENAVLIGTGIDELIRHHPSLKASVFEALKSTLTKIEELGNAFVAPQDLKHWYALRSAVIPPADEDVTMGSTNTDTAKTTTATSDQQAELPEDDNLDPGDNAPRAHDNNVVSFIDVLGRFLEGLFQHTAHCKEFITDTDCLECVGRLTALPCLPYDFANSLASDSWVQVMRTMTEVSTNETLLYLAKLVRESLTATANFWGALGQESKLLPLVDIIEEKAVEANQHFRQLVTLHIRISLLSDVFATAGYAHGRAAINLLQTLMSGDSLQVVPDLGALHRACIWENIVLKAGLVLKGIDVVASPQASPLEQSPTIPPASLPDVDGASTTNGEPSTSPNTASPSMKKTTTKDSPIREQNANALKHLTNGLTTSLAPFFQAVVKLFYARRNPDASQKKQILDSAAVVADVMLKHINHRDFVDKQSAYAFYSVMFGLLTILMMDERTQQNSLHTVLLLAFYRKGGLDAFFAVSEEFRVTIDEIMSVKPEDRSDTVNKELMSAYGGLKIALHLILPLISSKPLFESGQTLIVMTRDKKDTDPDYFEPHNFLVRLRLVSLPLLKQLWEAPWLVSAPLGVSKSVVQTVLELAGAENEETKGETAIAGDVASGSPLVMGGPPVFARPTGPDESRIRQLTDMGFPRSAAERALMRTHNNVNAATELLLAHPFPLPPDPDPDPDPSDFNESADQDVIVPEQNNPEAEEVATDVLPAVLDPVIPPVESNDLVTQGKSIEQWREELDTAREPLKAGLARQALRLVDEHPSLIFEVYAAFIRPADSHQAESVRCLMGDIKAFSPAAYDVQEQPLAMRCRLLALVLVEAPSTSSVEDGTKLMETLLALLLSTPIRAEVSQQTIPKWLGAHLLVTELLLTMGDQPQVVVIPTEDEPIVPLVSPGPSFREARPIIFDFCLRLLALPDLPNDELLSVLRLFVLLTRQHEIAVQFVERQGVSLLFQRLKSSTAVGSHSYIAIILRHIMEDQSVLQHIMRQELKRFFSQSRTRIVEAGAYMRHCNAIALRDPEVFVDVSRSLCQLDQPYSITHHIRLKIDSASSGQEPHQNAAGVEETGGAEMQVDLAPAHNTTGGPFESIIHFLVSEMMKNVRPLGSDAFSSDAQKPADSGVLSQDVPVSVGLGVGQKSEGQQEITDTQERYLYFIMQCLTELLFSYDSCKIAFLSYSPKKRTATPSKETALKHRTVALNFLLTDLISYGSINHHADSGSRGRMMMCNWAMSVIVALCVDTASPHEPKEVSPELVSVRKFVLEAVSRTIKDLTPSEHADTRYGRLLALSDLCYRLLTVRFNASARKPHDDSPTHVAKIMLEKNFVATLTNALADVDLNYPNIRSLVVAILKPLEHLTKIAIKMSRASDRNKDSVLGKADSDGSYGSEQDEDEDVEEAGREETPDLYRNSSLGMYGGEMEDVHYDPEDEMDEDEDDDNEDVEMDFGEETGSDDTSDTEGEEEEDLDEDTHESEGDWHDNDEEDEENLVEHDEDNAHADGDEEGAEVGAEEEILWQDIHEDEDIQDEGDDEEEEAGEPIPIIHADEEDEVEMMSDEEDYANEMGIADPNDPGPAFSLQGIFANAPSDSREQPFFLPRRQRMLDDDLQIFGQNRNIPAVPPEATTHPLLLDASSSNRVAPGQTRGSRRSRNIQGDSQAELLQTIEDLIGGGAVQLFHHIMTRSRGGGTEAIRLDIPAGAVVNLERGGGQRGSRGIISTSLRVERVPRPSEARPAGRDFDPLLTIQRWAEEVKILHGKFVQERANRLANHVVLALLPAAKEAAKEAKIKEEQEAARRHEEEAAEEARKKKEEEDEIGRQQTTEQEVEAKAEVEVEVEAEKEEGSSSPEAAQAEEARPPTVSPNEDALMQDASEESAQEVPPAAGSSMAPEESAVSPPAEGGSAEVAERVMVMIHGSAVDITDTGIDPTFLEALPDDMREEVLNQHVRDQRAARIERPPDSQISSEFLDALPPEIRAEIIQQERIEQAHRLAEEVTGPDGQGVTGAPSDIDPASFIASLEPQLRQVVLLDQDDGFIQTLPSHMIAEAGVYRDSSHRPRRQMMMRGGAPRSAPAMSPRKLSTPRDAIQLLEKSGIAMLVRLLFFPQVLKKNILYKVLVNLCENSKSRTELFNLVLNILQDGTGDLAAVDKSFSQMSVRTTKSTNHQTPKAAGKQKATATDYLALSNLQNEAVPDLIAQRCLEALTYIVTSNESSSLFFLTEHELPVGLRRTVSKKGKGKEKQVQQTHYPIVLLLGLLDRQSLLKTPSIMESVVGLLATVTRPLTSLRDKKKDSEKEVESALGSGTAAPAQASADGPQATPVAGAEHAPPVIDTVKDRDTSPELDEKVLLENPPQIPQNVMRLIVNILTIGECSGRTFQQSLALIQHLSFVPDARDTIAQELKAKAQEFGQSLYTDLDELATALQDSKGDILASSVASKFSPASSDQAKLLRVLKTIDYMYSSKSISSPDESQENEDSEKVQGIYESFRFTPLWRRLGDCLAIIEQKPDTEHIATVLLPLIEALMVVCKYVGSKVSSTSSTRALRASASPRSPSTAKETMEDLFVTFTDAHRKVLNLMVRNNPSLMSGSFSLLVNNPRVLDFDNKRNYFTQQLHRRPHSREHHGTLQLNVRRARVFEDSFQHLQRKTGDQIKYGKLSVRFYDEEGVDAGGVTREWFQILARQMFDPNNALFQPCAADKLTYQPNKNSGVNPEHLSFFKFVGRVIGKAIYDGRLLDAYFARSLYRQLLGKPVDYKDVEWVDPEYYNSLCWILENDPTPLDLNFSVEADEFGISRIVPLKEGGESVPVTQENKREFVQLSAQYRLYSSIKKQIESLLGGFYEVIPKELVTIFNEQELELLISGTPDIDVDEWRAATEYNGYSSSDPVIVWWWRALKSFNRDERAKVLSFATGTSRVPLSGFVDLQGVQGVQRFSIHKAYGEPDRLPQAHTCFNQIDLPQYSSYEMLRQQLLMAINEGGEGFGFA